MAEREDYDFFVRLFRGTEAMLPINQVTPPVQIPLPPEGGISYSDQDLLTDSHPDVWKVSGGKSYVIFVNGDLAVLGDITVEKGSFLAFIVNGDITLGSGTVEGIYIADGVILTSPCCGYGLDAYGTFVGWDGVTLKRTWEGAELTEHFTYRPDLLLNAPYIL